MPSTEMLGFSTPAVAAGPVVSPGQKAFCAPGRIRTRDPLLRRQLLYPTELQALRLPIVADEGHMLATLRAGPGYSERIKFTLFMDIYPDTPEYCVSLSLQRVTTKATQQAGATRLSGYLE